VFVSAYNFMMHLVAYASAIISFQAVQIFTEYPFPIIGSEHAVTVKGRV